MNFFHPQFFSLSLFSPSSILCESAPASAAVRVTNRFKLNYRQIFTGSSLGLAAGFALGKFGQLFIVACSSVLATIAYINTKGLIRINWSQIQKRFIGQTEHYGDLSTQVSDHLPAQSTFTTIRNWALTNPCFKFSFLSAFYVGLSSA
ncbi:mitocondrial FUN14 family protein [Schizosaccharomyces cryophilus OY26]|uniref:Mitocondrial FUN14 family protein n=1 Tax=Schizosaccharomyces cryophilus (strain OY26 / ATCC MYA-4695 / CBS 11777 / NBRC 106824 / NRRL Y48691) TaxID=653667 RepID=S9VVN0_SCHCR|nr:mitocondrial FUN14 family protein [Schizosaccharomyces cryophilus OY26]EPY50239.1 mitocondrial FUN14 family protein [Schizosaccharomyces cryophilus OY26]